MDLPPELKQLLLVDRGAHSNLPNGDAIYFFGDYSSGKGWDYSPENGFIANLKKKPSKRGTLEFDYKFKAMKLAIARLSKALPELIAGDENPILVPIPPSKCADDPDHDPRMRAIAKKVADAVPKLRYSDLIVQGVSMEAAHENKKRPTVDELVAAYSCQVQQFEEEPDHFYILDDVLTAGNHYAAVREVIVSRFGARVKTSGIFLTRTVRPNPFEAIDW